jgi:UDP-N-acetylglucosamine diphosphorylase/glucosamine-1-phosphate N-acetyltransferase
MSNPRWRIEMNLVFFEDSNYRSLYPLTLSRPACMLLCGTSEIYRKWVDALKPDDYSFLCREHLAEYMRLITGRGVNDLQHDDIILVNGRYLPAKPFLAALRHMDAGKALAVDGEMVACRPPAERPPGLIEALLNLYDEDAAVKALSRFSVEDVKADGIRYPWELIRLNGDMIIRYFEDHYSQGNHDLPSMTNVEIINEGNVRIGTKSSISPMVVIDASDGPVIVGDNVTIEPFTFIQGPVFIGRDCRLVGGRIRHGCSFGQVCRVGGEVEESIMLGYCNKYHEGFLGHACLGEWVNLGALTTNSDLKNNYSEIRVTVGEDVVDTGSVKVGCFIGDHTKTGIGTMLNTGISIGFSCNLYGSRLFAQPRIRSFSWGEAGKLTDYRIEKAVETARVSMARRSVEMGPVHERLFTRIHSLETGT